jgi:hypothetical protein
MRSVRQSDVAEDRRRAVPDTDPGASTSIAISMLCGIASPLILTSVPPTTPATAGVSRAIRRLGIRDAQCRGLVDPCRDETNGAPRSGNLLERSTVGDSHMCGHRTTCALWIVRIFELCCGCQAVILRIGRKCHRIPLRHRPIFAASNSRASASGTSLVSLRAFAVRKDANLATSW